MRPVQKISIAIALLFQFSNIANGQPDRPHMRPNLDRASQAGCEGERIVFQKQPENQEIALGVQAFFQAEVEVWPAQNPPQLQWQSTDFGSGIWRDLPGETTEKLVLSPATPGMNGQAFRLSARARPACEAAFSQPAMLQIAARPTLEILPRSLAKRPGEEAVFNLKINGGTGEEKIQWQVSRDCGTSFEDIAGATNLEFRVPDLAAFHSGRQYRVVAELPGGILIETLPVVLIVRESEPILAEIPAPPTRQSAQSASLQPDRANMDLLASKGEAPMPSEVPANPANPTFWDNLKIQKVDAVPQSSLPETAPSESNTLFFNDLKDEKNAPPAGANPSTMTVFTRQPSDCNLKTGDKMAVFEAEIALPDEKYVVTWQWSSDGGVLWRPVPGGGKGLTLQLAPVSSNFDGRLVRAKIQFLVSGEVFYSSPARISIL